MLNINRFITVLLLICANNLAIGNELEVESYGKFDISTQSNRNYDSLSHHQDQTFYTQSNGSRVGIKIKQQSTDKLSIIGQLEYAVDFNTNKSYDINFSNRNTYVGISGLWGEVLVGRHDTSLKLAQGNIDLFSDSDSQMWPLQRGENRVSNSLMFRSPEFNNFSIDFSLVNNANQATNELGVSFALKYLDNNTYMAFAIDKDILEYDVIRWVGSHSFKSLTFSALLQQSTSTKTNEAKRGYTLSASYVYSQFLLKMQLTDSDEIIEKGRYITIGVDWKMTANLLLYTFYTDRDSKHKQEQSDLISFGMKYQF